MEVSRLRLEEVFDTINYLNKTTVVQIEDLVYGLMENSTIEATDTELKEMITKLLYLKHIIYLSN